ncbi:hypothetical protein PIB30_082556 [Stylosanthes scabra]|uniref:Uncharacterized protein n=1 Tax=Stylosanthes scabra TaxID=79078 RepID=A0ABU6XRE3_9FABA|nr:hypothetical protein [Stylosanthes scabra]
MANMDPKTHGTNFDMKHALLIYVLMTQGGEPSAHDEGHPIGSLDKAPLQPPTISSRGASPGTGKATQAASSTGSAIRATSTTRDIGHTFCSSPDSLEPTMHDVMRRLDRQDRQIARTQAMIH